MAHRSPARFLAPLALLAVVFALFMVVQSSQKESDGSGSSNPASDSRPTATPTPKRKGPRRYRVKVGDTPSSIAEKTGVPLEDILRLNPDLDPQTIQVGQRIRLRQ
jgi:LysM repeat protein